MPFSGGSSPPRDWTQVSCIAGKFFMVWVTREAQCSCLHVVSLALSMEKWNKILWPPDAKSQLIGKDWCWERLMAGEGDDRGWDGWMASLSQWTWVWANSRRWWKTGKLGVLQSMGSQRVGHQLATELNWSGHNRTWNERNQSEQALLYGLNCMTFWKWQNYEDRRKISDS